MTTNDHVFGRGKLKRILRISDAHRINAEYKSLNKTEEADDTPGNEGEHFSFSRNSSR